MCGRFTITWEEWRRVAETLRIDDDSDVAASYRPRFNIAPTDQHFIVTAEFERRRVQRARWGLVNRRATDNRRASQCINAKAETLEQRATFREAFQRRRCIVPADGFYEWTGPKGKRQPLWIHPRSGDLMLFAGLYERWYPERNKPEVTFTIVTCAANAEDWMNLREEDPLSLKRLLVPAPSELLVMQPASPLANSVKNEGPALLEV
jgi:putative SOS response-associated peptidase YedK